MDSTDKSTMTKADIVEQVYQKIGFSKKEASELVELVFNELKGQLVNGDKVKISGFGNFTVKEKKERVGRNPQTGDQIKISARRVLTFKPSQVLKAVLNGGDVSLLRDTENE
jgi:integration host factor subunit alpha